MTFPVHRHLWTFTPIFRWTLNTSLYTFTHSRFSSKKCPVVTKIISVPLCFPHRLQLLSQRNKVPSTCTTNVCIHAAGSVEMTRSSSISFTAFILIRHRQKTTGNVSLQSVLTLSVLCFNTERDKLTECKGDIRIDSFLLKLKAAECRLRKWECDGEVWECCNSSCGWF